MTMVVPVLASAVPVAAEETRLNDGFHSFPEIVAKMRSAAENHSDIAAMYDLGELYPNGDGSTKTTWEGRHIWALKISDNVHVNESDEPDILYVGVHHAREWMTSEMMVWLFEHILADYGTNETITDLVDNRELWLIPVFNPDGFVYTETDDRTWRKNRRDNGDGTWGVDPNRNYGYKWGYDDVGSDPNPDGPTYRGPYPFSEPITQIMRDLAYDVTFELAISFHTYSEVMVYPPAYTRDHAPHYEFLRELGRRMSEHNGYDYGDVLDGILYPVNGGFDDFMYYNTSCLSFTYEMNSQAQGGFYVDSSLIEPTCTMNYEAALEIAKAPVNLYEMWDGGIEGLVMDPRGEPIENTSVHVELLADDTLDLVTGPDGMFSFHAPYNRFYSITASKEGHSTHSGSHQVLWRDRFTRVNITIKDNVAPVIDRVSASHEGKEGTEFGIGQEVRLDLWEAENESGLSGVVSIESFGGQYFHRRKPLTWDEGTSTYYYLWDTSGLKPRSDYLVTTELWDIDDNKDKDGVKAGEPDLTLSLRDITPPMVPINLSLSAPPEGGSLVLAWEANTDDTEVYTLQRRAGTDGPWAFLINLTKDDVIFTDQGLVNDVEYQYRMLAWDKVPLASSWSEVVTGTPRDTVPPGAMERPRVNAPPEGGLLELSWDEATDDAAVYLLYRDAGAGYELLGEFPRGTTSFTDGDLENDHTYFYKIAAQDASGNKGPESLPVLGMPLDLTAPSLPKVEPLPELTNLSVHHVSGTAEPFSTVVPMVNQEDVGQFQVEEDGTFQGTIELTNGVNRVSFKCYDRSLNPSGSTNPMLVQVDLNAPYVVSSLPGPDQEGVPVSEMISLTVSEGLVESSVNGRLVFDGSGTSVPAIIGYSTLTKTITVVPNTPLEKGTTYRVEVDGTDPAGNHLSDGILVFTTEKPEEPEPGIGSSTILLILLLVVIVAVVAVVIGVRMRRSDEGMDAARTMEPGPTYVSEGPADYDPRSPDAGEVYHGDEWDEY